MTLRECINDNFYKTLKTVNVFDAKNQFVIGKDITAMLDTKVSHCYINGKTAAIHLEDEMNIFTLTAYDRNNESLYSESKQCSTMYDWGNFNIEFRRNALIMFVCNEVCYVSSPDSYDKFERLK